MIVKSKKMALAVMIILFIVTAFAMMTTTPKTVKADLAGNMTGTELNNMTGTELNNMTKIGNDIQPDRPNVKTNWTPTGIANYDIRVNNSKASIDFFGIDTEGGDRSKTNLLKRDENDKKNIFVEKIYLKIYLKNGIIINSYNIDCTPTISANKCVYSFRVKNGIDVKWTIELKKVSDNYNLEMQCSLFGANAKTVDKIDLFMPFSPFSMGTCVLAEEWGEKGDVKAPLIINALDMGQLLLKGNDANGEKLNCNFYGMRNQKVTNLTVSLLENGTYERNIVFSPTYLQNPSASINNEEWAKRRRGLLSLLQITPYMEKVNGTPSPGGILGNNVISDPVSVIMSANFQWLSFMGDNSILDNINLNEIVKKTLIFWLDEHMQASGVIDYVNYQFNTSFDSNFGILLAVWDYYNSTKDSKFLAEYFDKIKKATDYYISRDVDNDGIIESFKLGNTKDFGDTAYDTISSGWKNAYVNVNVYKCFLAAAEMSKAAGDNDSAIKYTNYALKLRKAFNNTFFDEATGMYLWWIDYYGVKHHYYNVTVNANAISYGIADCLSIDTNNRVKKDGRDVANTLWQKFNDVSYAPAQGDVSYGKTDRVDYISDATNNYDGFYWGTPNNLEPVPPEYNFGDYGTKPFPYYCNGSTVPQDAIRSILAYKTINQEERANKIKDIMFKRQHEGFLENGSGFYMGVRGVHGTGYSICKWDGTPTDYEGIISRDCSFLTSVFYSDKTLFDNSMSVTNSKKNVAYDGAVDERIEEKLNMDNTKFQIESMDDVHFWDYPCDINRIDMIEGNGCVEAYMGSGLIGYHIYLPRAVNLLENLNNYALTFMIKTNAAAFGNGEYAWIELTSRGNRDDSNELEHGFDQFFDGKNEWKQASIKLSDFIKTDNGKLDFSALNFLAIYISRPASAPLINIFLDDFNIVHINDNKEISSFGFDGVKETANIDTSAKTISMVLPRGTNLSTLKPIADISKSSTIKYTKNDFNVITALEITASNGSKDYYKVNLSAIKLDGKQVLRAELAETYIGIIDEKNKEIKFNVPNDVDLSNISLDLQLSEGATCSKLGTDFRASKYIMVKSESGSIAKYKIIVGKEISTSPSILSVSIKDNDTLLNIDNINGQITGKLNSDANLKNLTLIFTLSDGATLLTDLTQIKDYSNNVNVIIKNKDGIEKSYVIILTQEAEAKKGCNGIIYNYETLLIIFVFAIFSLLIFCKPNGKEKNG